jgi:transcriptional regulator with XRE-family HTH domain
MTFPKSLVRAWMKRTNTNQKQLASALDLSETTICFVFQGRRHLSLDAAERLANLSGIPVEKLLTDPDTTRLAKLLGKRTNSHPEKVRDHVRDA